jgi:hypothetical protein
VPFVPDDFEPPVQLATEHFVLEPFGPEHNEDDYAAWSSSIEHIRATPGFEDSEWPHAMTLDENRGDLERHAQDFASRAGFTYTVLDPVNRAVIGCVYIYPDKSASHDATVTSWVRASHSDLDVPLRDVVSRWLIERWPFKRPAYATRDRNA